MILLDTNIFIETIKGNAIIKNNVFVIGTENVCTSIVCAAELYYGARDKREFTQIAKDLNDSKIYPITLPISLLALDLMKQHILSNKVGFPDFLIAATCLHHQIPLYTLNKKDFKFIKGIQLYQL
jgi:predicted nucleic acid-binding protein